MTLSLRLNSIIKALAKRGFNVTMYRVLPHGIDPFHDLCRAVPSWNPKIMFDVGANVGQSAAVYATRFPEAKVLSFEPAATTFQQLMKATARFPNIKCFNLGFAARPSEGRLMRGEHSDLDRLVPSPTDGKTSEPVKLEAIDTFCEANKVARIDYLKIDTEGGDLEVLRGAEGMLGSGKIAVIEVEVGIGLDNELHVPLQEIRQHLELRNYHIFGFYDQVGEWKRRLPHLRRANVAFIANHIDLPRALAGIPTATKGRGDPA